MIKKINSGAYFFQTQVAFHKKPYLDLIDFLKKENIRDKVKIIGGVFLLKSEKMMNFMKTIPGVFIPEDIEKRISSADNQLNEGIKICADLISDLKGFLDGVHIMAINSEEYIPDIINQVK
jgi:methylenetetrahydrofolate reductase (NADPH)